MKVDYHNLYVHFVFITLHRDTLILEKHRERIEKYITGIVNNNGCQMYAIYANPDHVHFLLSKAPNINEVSLAGIIEKSSEKFINENKLCDYHFEWQKSCSAFSVSKSNIDKVCKYILNQAEHHRIHTFKEEYDSFIQYYQKTLMPK